MSIEDALAKLRRKVEELGERRDPSAPPMRGLADGRRLGAAQDGDVPVFDKPSGLWVPGLSGSTCKVKGFTAPTPQYPSPNVEHDVHWAIVDENDAAAFDAAVGDDHVTCKKAGMLLLTVTLWWHEQFRDALSALPLATAVSNDRLIAELNFMMSTRTVHVELNGSVVIDSHRAPTANKTTCEGATVVAVQADDELHATLLFDQENVVWSGETDFWWPSVNYCELTATYVGRPQ